MTSPKKHWPAAPHQGSKATRCGLSIHVHAPLTSSLAHVTCPRCLKAAKADARQDAQHVTGPRGRLSLLRKLELARAGRWT